MKSNKKKVAIFTATRAEYGLLYWLMKDLESSDALQLQLLVSGAHLSHAHGHTIDQIEEDGFKVDTKIDLGLSNKDQRVDVAHAMSEATKGVADALNKLMPDVLILLGDRYELLGAASAALVMGVPIFHLHGGEITEGAYDDSIRHAVTKMATWHGVANNEYRQRVIQMGEPEEKVFTVGAMGLDNIKRLPLLSQIELEKQLSFKLGKQNALVTFHPVTNAANPIEGFIEMIAVLEKRTGLHIIFTYPNADHGRNEIVRHINEFVGKFPHRSISVESLGQLRFLSAMKYCDVMVGNSSSGIIEAPMMRTPSLNIGDRQKGRYCASTVLSCENDTNSIEENLLKAFTMTSSTNNSNPDEAGTPAQTMLKLLDNI